MNITLLTMYMIIFGCVTLLAISTYYYFKYDNNILSPKQKKIPEQKITVEKKLTDDNETIKKTLSSEGYECWKWQTNDMALRIKNGNVQCASIDGMNCIGTCTEDLNIPLVAYKPVTCGEYYKKLYDSTGYDDKNHWCYEYSDYKGGLLKQSYNDNILRSGEKVLLIGGQNGKYCCDDPRGMQCNRNNIDQWEGFYIERVDGAGPIKDRDIVFIKGSRNNNYCAYDTDNRIRCNTNDPGLWEKYIIINKSNPNEFIRNRNKIAFKSLKTMSYCSDVTNIGDFNKVIRCDSNNIGDWEEFIVSKFKM